MRKVTRARSAETRKGILEAAAAELSEMGYAAASIENIAARAGVSKMSVYYHFESKDALCIEAFTTGMERCRLELANFVAEKACSERVLAEITQLSHEHFLAVGRSIGSVADVIRNLEDVYRNRIEIEVIRYIYTVLPIIEDGQRKNIIIEGNPKMLARLFMGSISSISRWYAPRGARAEKNFISLIRKTFPQLILSH